MKNGTLFDAYNWQPVDGSAVSAPLGYATRYAPPEPAQASHEAQAALTPDVLTAQQQAVFAAILAAGASGLTDEEGIAVTGLNPSSYRPRRGELQTAGAIQTKADEFRLTRSGRKAAIWTAIGRQARVD